MRKPWENYFMDIAHVVAARSTCDRKHVGALIVLDNRIIATGYNGSIPGAPHCDDVGHDLVQSMDADGKLAPNCVRTVHAEVNAVAQAARVGIPCMGATIYVNTFPCWTCMKVVVTAGVRRIVFDAEYRIDARVERAAMDAGVSLKKLEVES